ncbi:MAG TPA: EscU/YscU/HrcU family type III secretion system export apparatus switch protein [Candidatus Baltobacteraceae bacterium]|nr:EscU/YscU/HrcU family type III secretion system export apparatus switch protein [Candidatus Baltobacteraceae bacterium]
MPAENRTEKATPRRRQKAREEGKIARSRDLTSSLTLIAVIFTWSWLATSFPSQWYGFLHDSLDAAVQSDLSTTNHLFASTGLAALRWAAPLMLVAWVVSIGATVAQGGLVFSASAFSPNWSRLNPANNLKNIFSVAGASRMLKTLLPLGVILYLVVGIFIRSWPQLTQTSTRGVRAVLALAFSLIFEVAWKATLVMLMWSGFDYFLQRLSFERSLRMTKEEVHQESKDTDGNPQVRNRIRKLRRDLRRRWKLKDVKRANVVVTNPEHYAVALEYKADSMKAPVVIAKGRDLVAQRIKHFALWHDVPIVENRPLAQALYKTVDVGESIPANLYTAVAEILAFIYRAQARAANTVAAPLAGARGRQ